MVLAFERFGLEQAGVTWELEFCTHAVWVGVALGETSSICWFGLAIKVDWGEGYCLYFNEV